MAINRKKAIICCRVSSIKQLKEGHGLEGQEQRCREYAKGKNYYVEKVFYDKAVSGALFERPAIKELLKHLDDNLNEDYIVLFDNIDRIARDVQVHCQIKMELQMRKARIESPNFNFGSSIEDELIENILASQAQYFRQNNARQVFQKTKARLERGYWTFPEPIGMKYIKTEEHGKILQRKEPEATVIKKVLEGFANNRYLNKVDVLNYLIKNKEKLKKDSGKERRIDFNFVNRILSQIVYTGYVEFPKWNVSRIKGYHEGLINLETFQRIQLKLNRDEKKITKRDNSEFPLRGIVNCSICEKKMTGANHTGKLGKRHAHYTCNNTNCKAKPKNIKKITLEEEYNDMLCKIAPESEIIELTRAIALDVWNRSVSDIKTSEATIIKENHKRIKQINHYLDLASKTSNDFARKNYETRAETLEKENLILEKQPLASNYLNRDEAIDEVLDFIGTPAKYWNKTNLEGKFMLHNLIFIANPKYDNQNGFGTPEVSLPFKIKDAFLKDVSSMVDQTGLEPATSTVQMWRSTR